MSEVKLPDINQRGGSRGQGSNKGGALQRKESFNSQGDQNAKSAYVAKKERKE